MNNNNTINNKMSADENKVAIVTGSSIGIDYETSLRLQLKTALEAPSYFIRASLRNQRLLVRLYNLELLDFPWSHGKIQKPCQRWFDHRRAYLHI